uniref:Uncharacterized protein n=1 Tax=Musa acuminata subsp. malaccensis TaxID=214687 RepID=A0A804L6M7_MUSAM
ATTGEEELGALGGAMFVPVETDRAEIGLANGEAGLAGKLVHFISAFLLKAPIMMSWT